MWFSPWVGRAEFARARLLPAALHNTLDFLGGMMSTSERSTGIEMKVKLSKLWIVVMFNMVVADILTFIVPGQLNEFMAGHAGGVQISQGILLAFAVLLEVPIAMIFLSRALTYRSNRWANIIACTLPILFVVGGGSTDLHYIFFGAIEVLCMLLIVWSAWKWLNPGTSVKNVGETVAA